MLPAASYRRYFSTDIPHKDNSRFEATYSRYQNPAFDQSINRVLGELEL